MSSPALSPTLPVPAAPSSGSRVSLRWKIAGLTGGATALVAVILLATFAAQTRTLVSDELRKRGQAVGVELANNLAFAMFSKDAVGMRAAADSTLSDVADVAYVVLRAPNGDVLAQSVGADLKTASIAAPPAVAPGQRVADRELEVGGLEVLEVAAPAMFEDRGKAAVDANDPMALLGGGSTAQAKPAGASQVGVVQVGFRLDPIRARISAATGRTTLVGLIALAGCLAVAWLVTRMLTVPLERLAQAAAGISRGDLRQEVSMTGSDEIAGLAQSFASMSAALRTLLGDLRGASVDLEREAAGLVATASQQSALAAGQASAINETSTTVSEIAQTSRQATEHADAVIAVTKKSEEYSTTGQKVVEETVQGMDKLGEQVRAITLSITELSDRTLQIGDIISTVKDLAERSNLLALNASLEAAKAGEQGRGFAVVAMEMRNLAEQSKLATNQVRAILSELQRGIRASVVVTEEGSKRAHAATAQARAAGESIVALGEAIRESAIAARQIAGNTRQQTLGVEQIVSAITQLSGSMNEAIEGTKTIDGAAGNLGRLSRRLSELVSRYTL